MKPRDLLNFLRSKSGRLILFGIVFAAILVVLGSIRSRRAGSTPAILKPADLDLATNQSQTVQSIRKPMEVFRPPPPKLEPPPKAVIEPVAQPSAPLPKPTPPPPPPPAPLSLFAEIPTAEPKRLSERFAPFGRLIPCETVITVDSASIQTPIIGLITENIYHAGRLIIPAGTEVHGTAQSARSRDRLASGTSWRLVWQSGEELPLKALALDREFSNSTNQTGWGITDGSAGLRGEILKTDNLAEIKLFAATFLSGAAAALTETQPTLFGPIASPSLNNAPLQGAQAVLQTYAQRIYDAIQRDGYYVRVSAGKQFYLYVLQPIDQADARVGGGEPGQATQNNSPSTTTQTP